MTTLCASLDPSLLTRLSDYVECHAEAASRAGFESQGGALAGALLSGCLLIYVALIGYRMMLGQIHDARAALLAAARAGLVIALASSWASYQPLAQTLVLRGPAEIATALLRPSGLEARTPAEAAKALKDLRPPASGQPTPPTIKSADVGERLPSTVGAWLALRLAAGILLGLGPLLVPLALFDSTLGLVEGWVRGLVAVLLGSAAVLIIATLEYGFWRVELARAAAAASSVQDPDLVSKLFGVAGWMALAAMVGIALSFRFRRFRLPMLGATSERDIAAVSMARTEQPRPAPALSEPARARSVAEAVVAHGRRERASGQAATRAVHLGASASATAWAGGGQDHVDTLGARRSAAPRRFQAARRRERRS